MFRLLFVLFSLISLTSSVSADDFEASPLGTFAGTDTNSNYTATVVIKVVEGFAGVGLSLSGDVVIVPKGKKVGVAMKLKGSMAGIKDSGDGKITYKDSRGKPAKFKFETSFNSQIGYYSMFFKSGTYGTFIFSLDRRVKLSDFVGSWTFSDGTPATIRRLGNDQLQASWSGKPGTGHDNLRGTMTGKISHSTWAGKFHVEENSVVVDNKFVLHLDPGPPVSLRGILKTGGRSLTLTKN